MNALKMPNNRVLNNETSPIEYYMEVHKMDLTDFGELCWAIGDGVLKDILNPKFLKDLSNKTIAKICRCF